VDLTQYAWIVWLALSLAFVVIELFTLEFTFAMLAVGTLLGGLTTALFGGPAWLQVVLVAVVAVLLLFLVRPVLRRLLQRTADATRQNVDAIPGQRGRVRGAFADGAGTVQLENGEVWSARLGDAEVDADAGTPLAEGDQVRVVRVLGATVEVRKEP